MLIKCLLFDAARRRTPPARTGAEYRSTSYFSPIRRTPPDGTGAEYRIASYFSPRRRTTIDGTRPELKGSSPAGICTARISIYLDVYGIHGQYRTKDRVVNVLVSVDTTVSSLPRLPNENDVIHLQFALHVQHNYAAGNIRPQLVWDAAHRLSSSPLYEEYEIGLC
ncbi:hypothetical protein JTE90_024753 [Oedothorax gibbosus]|uniref:Uncharacterized protein n=1 Tax=Oedothorax gibbosus TaxID=931172 RepID=A0AAV6U9L1_9ARAC|nr:hypothetical protein JTE90_024753 [Oedothorax gibbosus]